VGHVENCLAPGCPRGRVERAFLKSPHRAGAARQTVKELNPFDRARLRCAGEFLKSAKGAVRTTVDVRNCFAPHSVLRVFPQS
jgi:hypothetical protein